jgi:dipeptide/tripeptide permease
MTTKKQEKIKFSKAFWVANTVELFERAAYYGVFIVITLYLSRILGFNDIQAASIAGIFSACLYLLPTFAGALADKIGFRNSMLLAFTLLTCGYLGLAVYPTWLQSAGLVEYSTTTTFTGLLESNLQYGIIPIMAYAAGLLSRALSPARSLKRLRRKPVRRASLSSTRW